MHIASSPYRLADADVLIAVESTTSPSTPLATDVEGEVTVVAYTDLSEARSDLPEQHTLLSIAVADLLQELPASVGVVVDPRSSSPVHIPAADKQGLIEAGRPFPDGGQVRIGEPTEEPSALLAALCVSAPRLPSLRRLWRTWYQVEDARPRLLVVYDARGLDGGDPAAADLVVSVAQDVDYPYAVLVQSVDDVPEPHRQWLLDGTAAFYERP